ncbi:ankyrin repeat family protein [Legionella wadsworthii]|uniref:Ankyrin repeat family protein n=1 Tax=Legionella wadsworthii TaxID=28088 RepID=A0A378LUU0_9GAMM|nr:ankyrin repeat domain-containing protein [Legionella wadsworthii]STY31098.1 ankyrin repeat family protein [Legionella wadsworthii]
MINKVNLEKYPALLSFLNASDPIEQELLSRNLKNEYEIANIHYTPMQLTVIFGDVTHVKALLKTNFYIEFNKCLVLELAAKCGQLDILTLLMNSGWEKYIVENIIAILNAAIKGRKPESVRFLLGLSMDHLFYGYGEELLNNAIKCGDTEIIQLLLNCPTIAEELNARVLSCAADSGRLDVLEILLHYKRAQEQIASEDNRALIVASAAGHLEIVKYLLSYEMVAMDITAKDNEALEKAAKGGFLDVVKFLLTYQTVQDHLTAQNNAVLRAAISTNQIRVVQHLLGYKSVRNTVAANPSLILDEARLRNYHKVILLLLSCSDVFFYADLHENIYGNHLDRFIKETLQLLHARHDAFKQAHPNGIFNLDSEDEIVTLSHVINRLIRKNNPDFAKEMHFLLQIPSLNKLDYHDTKLRLSISSENKHAANLTFKINPSVAREYNQTRPDSKINLTDFLRFLLNSSKNSTDVSCTVELEESESYPVLNKKVPGKKSIAFQFFPKEITPETTSFGVRALETESEMSPASKSINP